MLISWGRRINCLSKLGNPLKHNLLRMDFVGHGFDVRYEIKSSILMLAWCLQTRSLMRACWIDNHEFVQ